MNTREDDLDVKKVGDKLFVGRESFPGRLYTMLHEVNYQGLAHIVSWQPHGRCFMVHRRKEFIDQILPIYFRMSKFTSFQRQLSMYGFERVASGSDKGGYYHERFLRGRKDLCDTIPRQQVKGVGKRQPINPATQPNFYLMESMPIVTPSAAQSLSGIMLQSAVQKSRHTMESSWMTRVDPSHVETTTGSSSSSGDMNCTSTIVPHPQHMSQSEQSPAIDQGSVGLGGGTSPFLPYGGTFAVAVATHAPHGIIIPSPVAALAYPTTTTTQNPFFPTGYPSTIPSTQQQLGEQSRSNLPLEQNLSAASCPLPASEQRFKTATTNPWMDAYVTSLQSTYVDALHSAYIQALQSGIPTASNDGNPSSDRRLSSSDDSLGDWMGGNFSLDDDHSFAFMDDG